MPSVIRYRIEGEISFDPSDLGGIAEIQRELAGILDEIKENGIVGGAQSAFLTARIHNKRNGGADA